MEASENSRSGERNGSEGGLLTLAGLLNIIWRRLWLIVALTLLGAAAGIVYGIVVTPLYRATAQVRPGITAYGPNGEPYREWHLKDVVRFYQRGLHGDIMRERLGWDARLGTPLIQADFIPRGTQNIQGGNVITLSTLAPSAAEASNVLRQAIEAFVIYAEADTTSNGLYLTRRGLEIQIAQLRNKIAGLANRRRELDLEIADQEAEMNLVEAGSRRVDLELRKVPLLNEHRSRGAERSEEQAQALRRDLAEVQAVIAEVRRAAPLAAGRRDSLLAAGGRDGLAPWLAGELARDDGEVLGRLVQDLLGLRTRALLDETRADSLRHLVALAEFAVEDLHVKKELELAKERAAIRNEIGRLQLERDHEVAVDQVELEQEITGREVQLAALSPLERIGDVHAGAGPVRPRRSRAVLILAALGLLGSLALAFLWEYVDVHRDEIFSRRRGRA